MMYEELKFLLAGDRNLVIEVGDTISREVHAKVQALYAAIDDAAIVGVEEVVPTYRSVSVNYNPFAIRQDELKSKISDLVIVLRDPMNSRVFNVPVLYGGEYGPDLEFVADYSDLPTEEVISIHTRKHYPVYMMGFAPGFAYLGGVSKRIAAPRLETPRTVIPAGSVGIADTQTGVYPKDSPGGWQLIGRTPVEFFNQQRNPPVFLDTGDYIHFHAIEQEEYIQIEALVEAGSYKVDYDYV